MILNLLNGIKNYFVSWFNVIKIIAMNILEIVANPSFIMFALIALGLGTMGIWVSFLDGGFESEPAIASQLDNLSVFTFCIATLGSMAVEYIFEEKGSNIAESKVMDNMEFTKMQSRHLAFFLWAIAAFLSFVALHNDEGIWYSLGATALLWLFVNIRRPKFQQVKKSAVANLAPNYNSSDHDDGELEFKGDGL